MVIVIYARWQLRSSRGVTVLLSVLQPLFLLVSSNVQVRARLSKDPFQDHFKLAECLLHEDVFQHNPSTFVTYI